MSGRIFGIPLRLFGASSTPGAVAKGDAWWRSDRDQLHVSDGNAGIPVTIGPTGNLPAVRSTAWHTLPPYGPSTSSNVPDGRLFALPLWPGRACTLTAAAVNVTLALVGGNIRMGVYSSDAAGTLPDALLADFGTVSSGLTGIRSITGLSVPLRPVLSWLVIARQGGLLNLGLSSRDTWDPIVSESAPTLANNFTAYYRDGVSGALPSTFGAVAGTILGPSATLQLT